MLVKSTICIKREIHIHSKDGKPMIVQLSLDNDCRNRFASFSLSAIILGNRRTGEALHTWNGKPMHGESYGQQHDEILAVLPELKDFATMSDNNENGVPLYEIENGYYHYINGNDWVNYLQLTPEIANNIRNMEDKSKENFISQLRPMYAIWKQRADVAKQFLISLPVNQK